MTRSGPTAATRRPHRGPAPRHLPTVDACSCGSSSRAWRSPSPPSPSPARPAGRPPRSAPRGPGCGPRWIARPRPVHVRPRTAVSTTRCPTRSSPRARCSPSRAPCCSRGPVGRPRGPVPLAANPLPPAPAPLALTWYGHSSVLLEVDGRRVLADPVWGERVSPSPAIGPRRLHPAPVPLSALPPVDAVVISHDHYDHLDLPTVRALLHTQDGAVRRPARSRQPPAAVGGPRTRGSSSWTGTSPTRSAA